MEPQTNTMSGNQQFLADLFATGVSGYVDSQYARNYTPNDPRNYNAGRPAGVSTAVALSSSPSFMLLGVAAVGLVVYLLVK